MIRDIEARIGRRLRPREIDTLNDITPAMIEELRALSDLHQSRQYLQFVVRRRNADLDDFLRDVVVGGQDPATWGFHDVFVAAGDDHGTEAFVRSWAASQGLLEPLEGERWVRLYCAELRQPSWELQGAVGIIVRRCPYWWRAPKGTHAFSGGESPQRIDDAYAAIAYRRWIASRASWWARAYLAEAGAGAHVDKIIDAAGVDAALVTNDARIALSALVRERASSTLAPQPSGFAGPDEWYRD